MAEYIKRVVSNADSCCDGNKIKTHFAQIIVSGKAEKPYYEILYFDTEDRTYHIGFGSYCLDYVFKWLSNEFEIVEVEQEADVAPVRHGRWIGCNGEIVDWDENNPGCPRHSCFCSICKSWLTASDEFPVIAYFCPNCGAKMDLEG